MKTLLLMSVLLAFGACKSTTPGNPKEEMPAGYVLPAMGMPKASEKILMESVIRSNHLPHLTVQSINTSDRFFINDKACSFSEFKSHLDTVDSRSYTFDVKPDAASTNKVINVRKIPTVD